MKTSLLKTFSPKKSSKKRNTNVETNKSRRETTSKVQKNSHKPVKEITENKNKIQENVGTIKSILKPNDTVTEKHNKSVRILDSPSHSGTVPLSTPTKVPFEEQSKPFVGTESQYDLNTLEQGLLGESEEETPLLEFHAPNSGTESYQAVYGTPVNYQCWPISGSNKNTDQSSTSSAPSSTPSLHAPPTSLLGSLLRKLYERYPTIITYVLVIFCFLGALYSMLSGKGTAYLKIVIKASLCWILSSDVAKMLFGERYCDISITSSRDKM